MAQPMRRRVFYFATANGQTCEGGVEQDLVDAVNRFVDAPVTTFLRRVPPTRLNRVATNYRARSPKPCCRRCWRRRWLGTGEKFADWWESQDVTGRNVWLREMGVR